MKSLNSLLGSMEKGGRRYEEGNMASENRLQLSRRAGQRGGAGGLPDQERRPAPFWNDVWRAQSGKNLHRSSKRSTTERADLCQGRILHCFYLGKRELV